MYVEVAEGAKPSFCSYIAVGGTPAPRSMSKSLDISILGSLGGSCQANSKEGTNSRDYEIFTVIIRPKSFENKAPQE